MFTSAQPAYMRPPTALFHHQSYPGGLVKCRLCQDWTTDTGLFSGAPVHWTTHLTVHHPKG